MIMVTPETPDSLTLRITELTSVAALHEIAADWQRLWRADPNSTPFQSPAWLLPWWEHVGEGELHCLAARDGDQQLLALLPLYVYAQPATGERHLLLLGAGTSDYLDGLFDPSMAQALAAALLEHLAAAAAIRDAPWQRAFFSQLREGSPLLRHARGEGWPVYDAEPCSIVPVAARENLPPKLRRNLRRYVRRAQTQGALRIHIACDPAEATETLEQLIALHTRRWRGRGEAGVLSSLRVQAHHRAAVPGLQTEGLLRFFDLRLDGCTIAALYALRNQPGPARTASGDALLLYLIGFDPDYAELSPGSLLVSAAYDHCIAENIACLDLLRGGEAYKQLWGARALPTYGFELATC